MEKLPTTGVLSDKTKTSDFAKPRLADARSYKFRFWDVKQEQIIPHEKINKDHAYHYLANACNEREYIIPMQFTEMKDKNQIDIYEGDILFGREEGNGETTAWTDVYLIVFFKDGCFKVREKSIDENSCWCDDLCDNDFINEYEVIGNVYENADLLGS